MKKIICLMILSLAIGANAATFTVTKTADTADGVCDADCSLREAITTANALAGADVVVLPAGIYTTTIATTSENANANGDFDITGSLRITGDGEGTTFVEANAAPGVAIDRVFHVLGTPTTVLIENLTVRNGRTTAAAPVFRGGGIRNEGNLTLRKVTVSGNQTTTRGGGVTSTNPGTFLFLDRVTVTNNTANSTVASTFGGGVFTNFSIVRIRRSTFTFNQSIATVGAGLIGVGGGFYALDGDVSIKDSTFSNNSIGGTSPVNSNDGGGLRFVNLTGPMNVALERLTITNNQGLSGAALGGGIGAGSAAGTVDPLTINISSSTIANNSVTSNIAAPGGAALFLNGVSLATVTITNTNIVNNTATSTNPAFTSSGGAIYSNDANLTLQASNVSGNSAEIGGAIRNDSSPSNAAAFTADVTLNNSTVSGNTSTNGGAIANIPTLPTVNFPVGGTTNLSIKNSTVSGNFAANDGGAIFQDQPAATTATSIINNSTLAANRADSDNAGGGNGGGINNLAGTLTIKNTIVANNLVGLPLLAEKTGKSDDSGVVTGIDLAGNIVSADYNLFETTSGAIISGITGNNINGIDPNLGAFADNGGFGKTYRLNPASAARDAGDPANCQDNVNTAVDFDQRGLPRNQGGARCDIGATEEGGITWDGGGADNNFSTAANWEGDVVPSNLNYAIFNSVSGKNVTVDGSTEVRGVIYGGGYAGDMTINGNLRVLDIFYLSGGNITCPGEGYLTMAVGARFQRYSGYVVGMINHEFSTGTSENFVYPTGTALGYYPATINYVPALRQTGAAQNSGVSSFSVRANDGVLNGANVNQSVNVNWTLESFGVSPVDLTLNYMDENVAAAVEENFQFVRRTESVNTAFAPSSADTFDNSFKLNGVTSFSSWTLGNLAPTAASASVGGRVLMPNGGGIKGATVVLTGGNLPSPVYSQTNNFGYYRLPEVPVGQTYVITVNSKRYTFSNPSQIVNLLENLADLDFVSDAP